jgi:hypothetical protein
MTNPSVLCKCKNVTYLNVCSQLNLRLTIQPVISTMRLRVLSLVLSYFRGWKFPLSLPQLPNS